MASPGVIELPEVTDGSTSGGSHYIVTVYNNDHNTFDEVIRILMKATGCSIDEAEIETWEIDTLGKSVVHHGAQDECELVAEIIREIGIRVDVTME